VGVGEAKGHVSIPLTVDMRHPEGIPDNLRFIARRGGFKGLRIEGSALPSLHREVQGDEGKAQDDGKKEEALSHGRPFS